MSTSIATLIVYNAVIVLLWAVSFHQSRVIRKQQRLLREMHDALRAVSGALETTHQNFKKLAWATADLMGDDPATQRHVRSMLSRIEARDVMAEAKR